MKPGEMSGNIIIIYTCIINVFIKMINMILFIIYYLCLAECTATLYKESEVKI